MNLSQLKYFYILSLCFSTITSSVIAQQTHYPIWKDSLNPNLITNWQVNENSLQSFKDGSPILFLEDSACTINQLGLIKHMDYINFSNAVIDTIDHIFLIDEISSNMGLKLYNLQEHNSQGDRQWKKSFVLSAEKEPRFQFLPNSELFVASPSARQGFNWKKLSPLNGEELEYGHVNWNFRKSYDIQDTSLVISCNNLPETKIYKGTLNPDSSNYKHNFETFLDSNSSTFAYPFVNSKGEIFAVTNRELYCVSTNLDTITPFLWIEKYDTEIISAKMFGNYLVIQSENKFYVFNSELKSIEDIYEIPLPDLFFLQQYPEYLYTYNNNTLTVLHRYNLDDNRRINVYQFRKGLNWKCPENITTEQPPSTQCDLIEINVMNSMEIDSISWVFPDTIYSNTTTIQRSIEQLEESPIYSIISLKKNGCVNYQLDTLISPSKAYFGVKINGEEPKLFNEFECRSTVELSFDSNIKTLQNSWSNKDSILSNETSFSFTTLQDTSIIHTSKSEYCEFIDTIRIELKELNASLCRVFINENNKQEVQWSQNKFPSDSIYIFRETTVTDQYTELGRTFSTTGSFEDISSIPDKKQYRYRMIVKDQCGLTSQPTETHSTIHLAANQGFGGEINLFWTPYIGNDFNSYYVYKSIDGSEFTKIDSLSSEWNRYSDYVPGNGTLQYAIGLEIDPCDTKKSFSQNIIRSNIKGFRILGVSDQSQSSLLSYNLQSSVLIPLQNLKFVELYDLSGRQTLRKQNIMQSTTIDLSQLQTGTYLLKVSTHSGRTESKKLIYLNSL